MNRKLYYIVVIAAICLISSYFFTKYRELQNLTDYVNPSSAESEYINQYVADFSNTFKHLMYLFIIIPLIAGIRLLFKLKKKFSTSEIEGADKLNDISNFVRYLSLLCDEFASNVDLKKFEIFEDNGIVKISPEIAVSGAKKGLIKKYDLLNINNILKDIVNGKYKNKIFYQFLENKITLLKS
ncbi:MAG TPA: hypothetical protein PKY81_14860 [bacterium]|nr:hypothetical protein [bacterium]